MKKLKFIQPALVLALICLAVTLLLAATNEVTLGPINRQKEEASLVQKKLIFPEASAFKEVAITKEIGAAFKEGEIDVLEISQAIQEKDQTLGYVFISQSRGYAGPVIATTGIDLEGKIVMATISAPDDTPGLGKKVEEEVFTAQFTGLEVGKSISVRTGNDAQVIDSVSGATISSNGAAQAVNHALQAFKMLKEKGVIS